VCSHRISAAADVRALSSCEAFQLAILAGKACAELHALLREAGAEVPTKRRLTTYFLAVIEDRQAVAALKVRRFLA